MSPDPFAPTADASERRGEVAKALLDWISGPGGLLLAYYAFGIYIYDELEGWSSLNSCYFLTVASTTVGYGDFTPATVYGRIFTSFYIVIGITAVFRAMGPIVKALLVQLRALVASKVEQHKSPHEATSPDPMRRAA